MNFDIVKMNETHTADISEIEKICFSKGWSKKSLDYQLTDNCAHFFTAVTDNNTVIGYCGSHIIIDECYVDNIAVLPEFRNKGIGKSLTVKLIKNAEEKNCTFISLEVRPSNKIAVSLYKNLGFEIVGKRKNFYSSPSEDGLIMTLYLKKD